MRARARPSLVLVAALAVGCGRACSCSCDGADPTSGEAPASGAARAPPATGAPAEGKAATPGTSAAPGSAPPPSFGEGTGTAGGEAPVPQDVLEQWAKPDKAELARLKNASRRLAATKASASKTSATALGAVFPTRIAGFSASEPAGTGKVRVGAVETPVASRNYRGATRGTQSAAEAPQLYVKFTDTSATPEMRKPVVEALTQSTVGGGYYTRGAFVNGWPAVLTYAPAHRAGKAAVLVGDRFLLEARVSPVDDPEGIVTLLEALDWSALAPRKGPGK